MKLIETQGDLVQHNALIKSIVLSTITHLNKTSVNFTKHVQVGEGFTAIRISIHQSEGLDGIIRFLKAKIQELDTQRILTFTGTGRKSELEFYGSYNGVWLLESEVLGAELGLLLSFYLHTNRYRSEDFVN